MTIFNIKSVALTNFPSTVTDDLATLCKSALIIYLPAITISNILINALRVNKAGMAAFTIVNLPPPYALLCFVLACTSIDTPGVLG